MTDQAFINEINLLEAHANEALKIAARLRLKLQPVSTGRSKKNGLNESVKARLLARKNKHVKRVE